MSENWLLRRICGLKRDEVIGRSGKLQVKEDKMGRA
jgi:hypothetical protein